MDRLVIACVSFGGLQRGCGQLTLVCRFVHRSIHSEIASNNSKSYMYQSQLPKSQPLLLVLLILSYLDRRRHMHAETTRYATHSDTSSRQRERLADGSCCSDREAGALWSSRTPPSFAANAAVVPCSAAGFGGRTATRTPGHRARRSSARTRRGQELQGGRKNPLTVERSAGAWWTMRRPPDQARKR